MSENKHFVYDSITLDPAKTTAYNHDIFGPVTVFKDVVIAREIIHQYDDGWAYKPAKELENAYWTADGRWAKAGSHPSSTIIASKDDINGRTINPKFTKSLFDPKTRRPNNRGIVADLEVFDKRIAPDILEEMKTGVKTDVSIGFFFDRDDTPGTIDEDGHPLNGSEYDYVQRNFIIDHTAFALEKGMGRCPLPYCGIGADKNKEEEEDKEVTGDPFGEYEDFADCVAKNQDKDDPEAYCAEVKRRIEGNKSDVEESINMMKLEELKTKLAEILRAFDDLVEEEYQGNLTPITESERAKRYFNISDEDWDALTEREKESYIGRLPPKKMGPEEGKGDETDENQQDSPPEDTEEDAKEDAEEEDITPPKKKPAVDMSEVERAKKLLNL